MRGGGVKRKGEGGRLAGEKTGGGSGGGLPRHRRRGGGSMPISHRDRIGYRFAIMDSIFPKILILNAEVHLDMNSNMRNQK